VVGTAEEQLALRLGAFRLARRRGRIGEAAWAASRLRLEGVSLDPADVRFGRAVRVRLGHALRVARLGGAHSERPEVLVPARQLRRRRSLWRPLIAAEGAALLLVVALLLFVPTPSVAGGEPEGATPAQAAAIETQPPPLRGRTQPGSVLPVAFVAATPAPNPAPVPAAPASGGSGAAGGGTGSGGSGGGSGKGAATPTPAPAPTASPTPVPAPFIDPRNLVHVLGRVVDSRTRVGIANVCISYGTLDCSLASHTDANGNFDIPLDGRSSWIFRFIQGGYVTTSLNNVRLRPGPPINVGTVQLRKAP